MTQLNNNEGNFTRTIQVIAGEEGWSLQKLAKRVTAVAFALMLSAIVIGITIISLSGLVRVPGFNCCRFVCHTSECHFTWKRRDKDGTKSDEEDHKTCSEPPCRYGFAKNGKRLINCPIGKCENDFCPQAAVYKPPFRSNLEYYVKSDTYHKSDCTLCTQLNK